MLTLFRTKKVNISPFSSDNLAIDFLPIYLHEIVKFVQLTNEDLQNLKLIDDLMEEHAETIAKRHYAAVMEIPEIRDLFEKYTTYDRQIKVITRYYKQITKGKLDKEYVDYRKLIGEVHSRIQLTEEWYIGAYMRAYEYLLPHITVKFASKPEELSAILLALNRIITFDTIIVLKAYAEANEFKLIKSISGAMDEVMEIDEIGELLSIVDQTSAEANEVNDSTQELNVAVEQVAETAMNASTKTTSMVDQAGESKQIVESSLTGFLTMIDEFQASKKHSQALTEKVNSIF